MWIKTRKSIPAIIFGNILPIDVVRIIHEYHNWNLEQVGRRKHRGKYKTSMNDIIHLVDKFHHNNILNVILHIGRAWIREIDMMYYECDDEAKDRYSFYLKMAKKDEYIETVYYIKMHNDYFPRNHERRMREKDRRIISDSFTTLLSILIIWITVK